MGSNDEHGIAKTSSYWWDGSTSLTPRDLATKADNWTLGGDAATATVLKSISENLIARASDIEAKLRNVVENSEKLTSSISNVNNTFLLLSNTQFIENRTYQDDETLETDDRSQHDTSEPSQQDVLDSYKRAIKAGIELVTSTLEKHEISDSESDDANPDGPLTIFKRIDPYSSRHLPHIIGSKGFYEDKTLGIRNSISSDAASTAASTDSETEGETVKFDSQQHIKGISSKIEIDESDSDYLADSLSERVATNSTKTQTVSDQNSAKSGRDSTHSSDLLQRLNTRSLPDATTKPTTNDYPESRNGFSDSDEDGGGLFIGGRLPTLESERKGDISRNSLFDGRSPGSDKVRSRKRGALTHKHKQKRGLFDSSSSEDERASVDERNIPEIIPDIRSQSHVSESSSKKPAGAINIFSSAVTDAISRHPRVDSLGSDLSPDLISSSSESSSHKAEKNLGSSGRSLSGDVPRSPVSSGRSRQSGRDSGFGWKDMDPPSNSSQGTLPPGLSILEQNTNSQKPSLFLPPHSTPVSGFPPASLHKDLDAITSLFSDDDDMLFSSGSTTKSRSVSVEPEQNDTKNRTKSFKPKPTAIEPESIIVKPKPTALKPDPVSKKQGQSISVKPAESNTVVGSLFSDSDDDDIFGRPRPTKSTNIVDQGPTYLKHPVSDGYKNSSQSLNPSIASHPSKSGLPVSKCKPTIPGEQSSSVLSRAEAEKTVGKSLKSRHIFDSSSSEDDMFTAVPARTASLGTNISGEATVLDSSQLSGSKTDNRPSSSSCTDIPKAEHITDASYKHEIHNTSGISLGRGEGEQRRNLEQRASSPNIRNDATSGEDRMEKILPNKSDGKLNSEGIKSSAPNNRQVHNIKESIFSSEEDEDDIFTVKKNKTGVADREKIVSEVKVSLAENLIGESRFRKHNSLSEEISANCPVDTVPKVDKKDAKLTQIIPPIDIKKFEQYDNQVPGISSVGVSSNDHTGSSKPIPPQIMAKPMLKNDNTKATETKKNKTNRVGSLCLPEGGKKSIYASPENGVIIPVPSDDVSSDRMGTDGPSGKVQNVAAQSPTKKPAGGVALFGSSELMDKLKKKRDQTTEENLVVSDQCAEPKPLKTGSSHSVIDKVVVSKVHSVSLSTSSMQYVQENGSSFDEPSAVPALRCVTKDRPRMLKRRKPPTRVRSKVVVSKDFDGANTAQHSSPGSNKEKLQPKISQNDGGSIPQRVANKDKFPDTSDTHQNTHCTTDNQLKKEEPVRLQTEKDSLPNKSNIEAGSGSVRQVSCEPKESDRRVTKVLAAASLFKDEDDDLFGSSVSMNKSTIKPSSNITNKKLSLFSDDTDDDDDIFSTSKPRQKLISDARETDDIFRPSKPTEKPRSDAGETDDIFRPSKPTEKARSDARETDDIFRPSKPTEKPRSDARETNDIFRPSKPTEKQRAGSVATDDIFRPSKPTEKPRSGSVKTDDIFRPSNPTEKPRSDARETDDIFRPSKPTEKRRSDAGETDDIFRPSKSTEKQRAGSVATDDIFRPSKPTEKPRSGSVKTDDIFRPSNPTEEPRSDAGETDDIFRPSKPTEKLRSDAGEMDDIFRPSKPTEKPRSDSVKTDDIFRPSNPTEKLRSDAGETDDIFRPSKPTEKPRSDAGETDDIFTTSKPIQQLRSSARETSDVFSTSQPISKPSSVVGEMDDIFSASKPGQKPAAGAGEMDDIFSAQKPVQKLTPGAGARDDIFTTSKPVSNLKSDVEKTKVKDSYSSSKGRAKVLFSDDESEDLFSNLTAAPKKQNRRTGKLSNQQQTKTAEVNKEPIDDPLLGSLH